MLLSFRVSNHKSIRDEQTLHMQPVYDKGRPALPVVAIFGANAAGKSNLLDALRFMQTAVRTSFSDWEPRARIPRQPFRLDPLAKTDPSQYVAEFAVNNVRYAYGFAIDNERIREEWLYVYPKARKRIIFERNEDGRWRFGTTVPRGEVDVLRRLTRDNSLFLSIAGHSGLEALRPAYRWFQEHVAFQGPEVAFRQVDVIEWLESSAERRAMLIELARAADLGIITDMQVRSNFDSYLHERLRRELNKSYSALREASEHDKLDIEHGVKWLEDEISAMDSIEPDLLFLHGAQPVAMTVIEQSQGTIAWLNLLLGALKALENGWTLCIDEIDSSLHPRLTARLLELFHDERTNDRGGQLLFTTHDATLLSTSFGDDILARDEIWFVEKDGEGMTRLFALSDFYPRKEENRERRYLGGSYDAVPAVYSGTLVERLLKVRREATGVA